MAATDPRVEIVEGSVTDLALLQGLMRGTDYVFHLAALWLYECVNEPRSALDVNVVGTYNVVESAADAGVERSCTRRQRRSTATRPSRP